MCAHFEWIKVKGARYKMQDARFKGQDTRGKVTLSLTSVENNTHSVDVINQAGIIYGMEDG